MNPVREAWAAGRPALGSWLVFPSTLGAEVMARSGFDWLLLDAQHGGMTWDNLTRVMQAVQLGGAEPIVRIGWNEPEHVMRALDLGAAGVVVPMVSTPEDALVAAQAARYPPEGIRSFGPTRNLRSPADANDDVLCLVMIETEEALEHLDAIAATPGVDGLFVGPVDLALSMGLEADFSMVHPQVMDAIDAVIEACRRHDCAPGAVSMGLASADELLRRGIRFLTLGSDYGYIAQGAAHDIEFAGRWVQGAGLPSTAGTQ